MGINNKGPVNKSNSWDTVPVKNKKLQGMLTDDLIKDSFVFGDGGSKSSIIPSLGNIGERKVHRTAPRKFK